MKTAFAFLAPEIVNDVIDQIAGRKRFTADHLNLSTLTGTWGDFFRGAGSIFYLDTSFCRLGKLVCNNGTVEKRYVESVYPSDPIHTEKLSENTMFYMDLGHQIIDPIEEAFDLLCRISDRFYGRFLTLNVWCRSEMQESEEDILAKVKRALDGFQPRFEGIRVEFREPDGYGPQLYIDFVARMLQSKFLRSLIIVERKPLRWNLEDLLISFCRSDRFELFKSDHFTNYSLDFVSAAYEALRSKNCPYDLKPRSVNVNVAEETAQRLAEKYEMVPIGFVVLNYPKGDTSALVNNFNIKYWKQEQNAKAPEMSVEMILAMRYDYLNKSVENSRAWRAIICLQKCNGQSLKEAYSDGGRTKRSLLYQYFGMEHGVELPVGESFRLRTLPVPRS